MNQKQLFQVDLPQHWPPEATDWYQALQEHWASQDWVKLQKFVEQERRSQQIFPPADQTFNAFRWTRLDQVAFVILGQDPYHGPGQAHGLSFSVQPGIKTPPSLVNIFKELQEDVGVSIPNSGDLTAWAKQGGLLLNTVLTVRSAEPNSHRKQGWESLTDAAIKVVNAECQNVVFVLWGGPARKKAKLISADKHLILESAHPSPLSSYRGFFGSKPFSQINRFRKSKGLAPICWQLD